MRLDYIIIYYRSEYWFMIAQFRMDCKQKHKEYVQEHHMKTVLTQVHEHAYAL